MGRRRALLTTENAIAEVRSTGCVSSCPSNARYIGRHIEFDSALPKPGAAPAAHVAWMEPSPVIPGFYRLRFAPPSLRSTGVPNALTCWYQPYVAWQSASIRPNQSAIWFQLVKIRVTKLSSAL